jgi:hypothetical protein
MNIRWPKMCAGCGELGSDKIFPADYTWRHSVPVGGGYGYTTYNIRSMPVQAWLCISCRAKIITRYILIMPIWLAILAGAIVGLIEVDEPYPFIPMLPIGMIGFLGWLILRFQPVTHVMQFRLKAMQMSGDPTLHFHNARYKAVFDFYNSGLKTKLNHVQTKKETLIVQDIVAGLSRSQPPQFPAQPKQQPPAQVQQPASLQGNVLAGTAGTTNQVKCPGCGRTWTFPGGQVDATLKFCNQCGTRLMS